MLSFLILVTALVVQKWKNPTASGKQPPVAKIASPEVASAAPTAQAPIRPVGIPEHPDKAKASDKDQQRIASGPLTPPLPSTPAVASDLPPPVALAPALKVPDPATEPAQYTIASNPEPALPPSASSAPESRPAEAPATVLPPDLPATAGTSPAEMSPAQAPASAASVQVPPSSTGSEALGPIPQEKRNSERPLLSAEGPAPVAAPLPSEPSPGGIEAGTGAGVDASVVHAPFNPPPLSPAEKPDSDSPAKRTPKAPKNKGGQAPIDKSGQPATIASNPSGGPTRSSELPNFATAPESVDPATAGAPTANPFADPAAGAGQGGWVQLPNAAVRQSDVEALNGRGGEGGPGIARTGASNLDAGDLVESVPHTVVSGENFFSIAQQYYGSGRFYPALWKANSDQVPAPEKLRVGQTIRIPPPEALDRSQILPPRTASGSGSNATAAMPRNTRMVPDQARSDAATGRSSAVALALPVADPFNDRNRPGNGPSPGELVASPSASASDRRRLPRYKIRPQETLRSIARDTLGDSRRAGEILELNREVIDDPNYLTTGQEIELPEDARLARRGR